MQFSTITCPAYIFIQMMKELQAYKLQKGHNTLSMEYNCHHSLCYKRMSYGRHVAPCNFCFQSIYWAPICLAETKYPNGKPLWSLLYVLLILVLHHTLYAACTCVFQKTRNVSIKTDFTSHNVTFHDTIYTGGNINTVACFITKYNCLAV